MRQHSYGQHSYGQHSYGQHSYGNEAAARNTWVLKDNWKTLKSWLQNTLNEVMSDGWW